MELGLCGPDALPPTVLQCHSIGVNTKHEALSSDLASCFVHPQLDSSQKDVAPFIMIEVVLDNLLVLWRILWIIVDGGSR